MRHHRRSRADREPAPRTPGPARGALRRSRRRAAGLSAVFTAVLIALLPADASAVRAPDHPSDHTKRGSGPSSHPPRRLAQDIEEALADAPSGATIGVAVLSGRTGAILYARSADRLLIPASNAKVFVLGAALSRLGPEHAFRTEVLATGPLDHGTLRGALILRGSGDPSLTSEGLWGLVLDLEAAGLRRVEGDMLLDDTAFAPDQPPAAGPDRSEARPYGAVTSALTANFNTIALEVAPGIRAGEAARVTLVPPPARRRP